MTRETHRSHFKTYQIILVLFVLTGLLITGCAPAKGPVTTPSTPADPLASWNDGETKTRILDFVDSVTNPTSSDFVEPEDRLAVFDQDGTLWAEKPVSGMEAFVQNLVHPGPQPCTTETPTDSCKKSELGDDWLTCGCPASVKKFDQEVRGFAVLFHGKSERDFRTASSQFLNDPQFQHPRFCVPYIEVVYKPMVELLNYLSSKQFRLFIISGGAQPFMMAYSRQAYGIPEANVIGTTVVFELDVDASPPDALFTATPLDRIPGSPSSIWKQKAVNVQTLIGQQPLIAAGNAICGDYWMLEAASGPLPSLALVVDHDDAEREYCYEDPITDVAKDKGWTVISMKHDFAQIFDFPNP